MGLFARKKIEDITDADELLVALARRRHWCRIPQGILRLIFDNADGDIYALQRFRVISELQHCVERNFIPIVDGKHDDPKMVLFLFSATLERVAAQAAQLAAELPGDSSEREMTVVTALAAYKSSILCNPLMLPSYAGLAFLYAFDGSCELAAQACRDYDSAERRLISVDDDTLSRYDLEMKANIPALRKLIDQVKAESDTIPESK